MAGPGLPGPPAATPAERSAAGPGGRRSLGRPRRRAVGLALGRVMILGPVVGRRVALAIAGVRLVLVTAVFRRGRMAGPQAREPLAEMTGAASGPRPAASGPAAGGHS